LKKAPFAQSSAVAEGFSLRQRLWRDKRRQAQILILEILKVFLAVPMKIGRVTIFAFLGLEQN